MQALPSGAVQSERHKDEQSDDDDSRSGRSGSASDQDEDSDFASETSSQGGGWSDGEDKTETASDANRSLKDGGGSGAGRPAGALQRRSSMTTDTGNEAAGGAVGAYSSKGRAVAVTGADTVRALPRVMSLLEMPVNVELEESSAGFYEWYITYHT